jgi:hypothetical protein
MITLKAKGEENVGVLLEALATAYGSPDGPTHEEDTDDATIRYERWDWSGKRVLMTYLLTAVFELRPMAHRGRYAEVDLMSVPMMGALASAREEGREKKRAEAAKRAVSDL